MSTGMESGTGTTTDAGISKVPDAAKDTDAAAEAWRGIADPSHNLTQETRAIFEAATVIAGPRVCA